MPLPTRNKIITTLVTEALDDPEIGWLSDIGGDGDDLEYDQDNETIVIHSPEHRNPIDMGYQGSIDVGQLAGVIKSLIQDTAS